MDIMALHSGQKEKKSLLRFYRMVTRLLLIALSFGNAAVLFAQEVLPVEAADPRSLAVEALPDSTRKGRLSYSAAFETEVSRELPAQ
jgi:hypothetical protein